MSVTIDDIRSAAGRIAGAVYRSPCPYSLSLSRLCGAEIYCKLDHLQMTGSFKERGARNKLELLDEVQRRRGVIAASAGNHALGLAYHGRELGIPVTVVMPRWAPMVKVANCREFGASVIQHGEAYDEARTHALELSQGRGLTFVPGFDDPAVIAGAGTVGLEIIEDMPDLDAVIVPVGGGGLIAGIATAVKAVKPSVRVIGVEPHNAPTLHESLRVGELRKIPTTPTLADGLAVAEAGRMCFEIARRLVDEIILVDEGQIARAVLKLLELEKMVVEGAGAVSLAGAVQAKQLGLDGRKVALVLCGGNIDLTMLSRVIDRGLAVDGRLCRVDCRISDRPGGLARLTAVLASTGASVKEVSHDRHFAPADVAWVKVSCVLETRNHDHIRQVLATLSEQGIDVAGVSPERT